MKIWIKNLSKQKLEDDNKNDKNRKSGPIASVGMVVAINTSDSTFGWYGKRQE